MVPNNFHLAQTTKTIVVIETELILLTTDLQDCKNSMIVVPIERHYLLCRVKAPYQCVIYRHY